MYYLLMHVYFSCLRWSKIELCQITNEMMDHHTKHLAHDIVYKDTQVGSGGDSPWTE